MNIEFYLAEAERFCERLATERGYETVYFNRLEITRDSKDAVKIEANIDIRDAFQEGLDYGEHWHHGFFQHFPYPFDITSIPSREERELRTLMKLGAKTTELQDAFQSAFARRFVDNLVRERRELVALVNEREERF